MEVENSDLKSDRSAQYDCWNLSQTWKQCKSDDKHHSDQDRPRRERYLWLLALLPETMGLLWGDDHVGTGRWVDFMRIPTSRANSISSSAWLACTMEQPACLGMAKGLHRDDAEMCGMHLRAMEVVNESYIGIAREFWAIRPPKIRRMVDVHCSCYCSNRVRKKGTLAVPKVLQPI